MSKPNNSNNSNCKGKGEANGKAAKMREVYTNTTSNRSKTSRQQPKKDSSSKRVNYDNARMSRYERDTRKPNANDIAWYSRNPELLKAAGSVPFASILGKRLFDYAGSWSEEPQFVQGVMALGYSPSFGPEDQFSGIPSALNQAGKSMYSFLVHANSRNYTYEYQDLMMLIIAGAQVFAAIGHAQRAYGAIKAYQESSIYTPDAILTAMGFDPTDFRNNLSKIWFDLNDLVNQTTQIWIPNTIPLIQRWFWLNSNLFTDAEGARGQVYMFVPNYFLRYNETASDTGGVLELAPYKSDPNDPVGTTWKITDDLGAAKLTWAQYKSMVQGMIDALVNSEDRGIIFGDILNAYGADKLYAMSPIPSDYIVLPAFNSEVLTQIENTVTSGCKAIGLRQDTRGLFPAWKCPPVTGAPSMDDFYKYAGVNQMLINFHQGNQPTPEQIVIATRLSVGGVKTLNTGVSGYQFNTSTSDVTKPTVTAWSGGTGVQVSRPLAIGSEIVNSIRTIVPDSSSNPENWTQQSVNALTVKAVKQSGGTSTPTLVHSSVSDFELVASFDWHPFLYTAYIDGATSDRPNVGQLMGQTLLAYGDYDNYTVVDYALVQRIHEMAMYSLWGVPQM